MQPSRPFGEHRPVFVSDLKRRPPCSPLVSSYLLIQSAQICIHGALTHGRRNPHPLDHDALPWQAREALRVERCLHDGRVCRTSAVRIADLRFEDRPHLVGELLLAEPVVGNPLRPDGRDVRTFAPLRRMWLRPLLTDPPDQFVSAAWVFSAPY